MKPGTIIKLADGREATVVYHNLDGYGIRFGRIVFSLAELQCIERGIPDEGEYELLTKLSPEAMLRDPYPDADLPCVGKNYVVIEEDFI
jgi:hypothetical protein